MLKYVITLITLSVVLVAGGLLEDIVTEPKVKVTYTTLPDKPIKTIKPVKRSVIPTKPIITEEVIKEAVPVPAMTLIPQNKPVIVKDSYNWFADVGLGYLSGNEEVKRIDACGNASYCHTDRNNGLGILGRVGYTFDNSLSPYVEVQRSKNDTDLSVGLRYTAYEAIKVFGSYGINKLDDIGSRSLYKLGAGYFFNEDWSMEVIGKQTDKVTHNNHSYKNKEIGVWLIYTIGKGF